MDIYQQTGVLLTPGDGFGHAKRGQFRLVYSYVPKEQLEVAMDRVEEYVKARRS
jgi:1-aminocyclopropane-1-carboxylate synthase